MGRYTRVYIYTVYTDGWFESVVPQVSIPVGSIILYVDDGVTAFAVG